MQGSTRGSIGIAGVRGFNTLGHREMRGDYAGGGTARCMVLSQCMISRLAGLAGFKSGRN